MHRSNPCIPWTSQRVHHLKIGQPKLILSLKSQRGHTGLRRPVRHLLPHAIHEARVELEILLSHSLDLVSEPLQSVLTNVHSKLGAGVSEECCSQAAREEQATVAEKFSDIHSHSQSRYRAYRFDEILSRYPVRKRVIGISGEGDAE